MKLISQSIWRNSHLYFFYLFLISIPFQTRKVFLTEYSFYSGAFTEWTTAFLYVSDIFLILALVFWAIVILRSRNYQFKNTSLQFFNSYKNSNYTNTLLAFLKNKWLFLFVFLAWLVLNLAINREYFAISAFQVVKFIELVLLIIFVYFNLRNSKILIKSLFILAFSGFLQSVIAIYQFIAQHSAFSSPTLAKITGESIIGPQMPGVAKIIVDSDKVVRAYGTFPHPNVLGGFLVFTILITIYLYLEHKKYNLSNAGLNLMARNSDICANQRRYSRMSPSNAFYAYIIKSSLFYDIKHSKSQVYIDFLFWTLLLSTQFVGLFFTFSRSTWLGLLLSLLIISAFYFYNYKIVSRETIFNENEIVNNFSRAFYKFIIVSRETINSGITKQRFENCLCKFKNIKNYSFFVIPAKAGIYCYNKIKLFLQTLILPCRSLSSEDCNKKARDSLEFCGERFQWSKNEEVLNTANKRNAINNITLFNKLSTVFQHNVCIKSIIGYKELFIALIIIIAVVSINLPLVLSRLDIDSYNRSSTPDNPAINDRIFYNDVSRETICNNFFGSGVGTFIFQIDNYLQASGINQKLQPWQYQPAHNIYFLIASEVGIVGLILFLLFIVSILYNFLLRNFKVSLNRKRTNVYSPSENEAIFCNKINLSAKTTNNNVSRETLLKNYSFPDKERLGGVCNDNNLNIYLFAILIAFLFIGLFDHYFWTLQQGRLMFWLVLGMLLVLNSKS